MSESDLSPSDVDEALIEADGDDGATTAEAVVPEAAEVGPDEPDASGDAMDAAGGGDDLDDLLGLAGADVDDGDVTESGGEPSEADEAATDEAATSEGATGEDEGDEDAADADESVTPERRRRPESIEDVRDRRDLIRLIGDWFVVHTYSGYEQRVKDNLANRAESLSGGDRIFETVIPTEEVTEFKKGKKQVVQKKFLPGYVLVRMELDDETWNLVRHTPAVTGFVGASANKPVPLSLREVASTLSIPDRIDEESDEDEAAAQEAAKAAVAEIDLELGETVRITDGPFADFTGTIDEINLDQAKLKVLTNVFGRETPIDLQFDMVAKIT